MTPRTRLVYVETPANPTLAVTDIAAVAALARERGAVTVVDSTFATPYHQRPLALGADLVVHSATKAIGGHGDAIGGVVVGDDARVAAVHEGMVRIAGAAMSPWNAHMLTRGARTLALRAARMAESALALAERLEAHPGIERVWYPGLLSHPQHAVARRQMMRGYGGLVAVELRGGAEAGRAVYDRVRLFTRAVSLGDVRSLITHPATTTHVSLDPAVRRAAGIRDGTMRLSIGIEDMEDLWRDLERALHWR
jgi:cystathionine beta-lyase/cystathionine gamma-synthase